jgi:hypothetical protein
MTLDNPTTQQRNEVPMKSFDYDAVVTEDGEICCVECAPKGDHSPIFADSEWDHYPVCEQCGAVHDYVSLTEEGRALEAANEAAGEAWVDAADACRPGCEGCDCDCHATDEDLKKIDPTFVCRRKAFIDGWEVSIDVSVDSRDESKLRVVVEAGGVGPHALGVAGGVMPYDKRRGFREQVLEACDHRGWFWKAIDIAEERDPHGAACAAAIVAAQNGDRSMMN